jgi:hypothetical protein
MSGTVADESSARSRGIPVRNARPTDDPESPGPNSVDGANRSRTTPLDPRARAVRWVLPEPISARHAVVVLLLGFGMEGGTELYQLLNRGDLVQGPLEYYATLATTIFGFYLMFRGLREWHAFYPRLKRVTRPDAPRAWPWFGLALWVGGTLATALVSLAWGFGGTGGSPVWVAWPVGGVVVFAFGNFFFGLRQEAQRQDSPYGGYLGGAAFLWSLGVATVAGAVVGELSVQLLTEFVTNWVALIASVGPIVVAMSPLFVTYALMISAFWPALRSGRGWTA